MKIKIYGTGCPKCRQLAENVKEAVAGCSDAPEVEKVTDINAIVAAGIVTTPALEVDGKIVSTGRVPAPREIAAMLGVSAPAGDTGGTVAGSAGKNGKRLLTLALLLFVGVSLAIVARREIRGRDAASEEAQVAVGKDVLTVYYFHGTQRCMKCNKIEQLAREAIEGKYADALKDGSVVFSSVNLDDPANRHFIKDFQLTVRSVVMARGDRFKKFDEVWNLVGDPDKFIAYIQDGAAKMTGDGE